MRFCLRVDGAIATRLVAIDLKKFLIILSWHIDVDVVIPGDIATMTDSTDERAATEKIGQSVLLAELMNMVEYAHLQLAQLLNIGYWSHWNAKVSKIF